jgi:uncharacterized membrane protein
MTTTSTPTRPPTRPVPSHWRDWRVVWGILLVTAIPLGAGVVRLLDLSGVDLTSDDARFHDSPLPVVVHVVGAILFTVLGALQLVPSLRRNRPAVHRWVGRVALPAGLAVALSGLWMTVAYPLPARDTDLLNLFRVLAGGAMVVALVTAFAAIRRRDVPAHRAWMLRGYALGLGAASQFVMLAPWALVAGAEPEGTPRALVMGAAWLVNLTVAEWVIHRSPGPARSGSPAR